MINKYRVKKRLFRILFYFLLYTAIIGIIAPFIIMVFSSLMSEHELYLSTYPNFHLIPEEHNSAKELFSTYTFLLTESKRGVLSFLNSIKIAIPTTLISVIFAALAAYPLSRTNIKGKNTILFTFLFASMVPTMAILIPLYLQWVKLKLYDTTWGVIIVLVAYILPFSIWIMKGFFDTIPDSLEEAAQIDGCSRYKALQKVIIPLALPGIGAVAVFAFISSWAEFLIPLVLTQRTAQVFTVYIGQYSNNEMAKYTWILASGVIACIPVIILAVLFQRFIVKGLIEGAVKG